MAAGWRYTVAVPSWSHTQLKDDEAIVFYSVEVTLLPPPESGAEPRKHTLLRRFSHFQKLYTRLRELHGVQKLASMRLPPKLALSNVAKHPELIDRRRVDLEQWLWRVVNSIELARSPLLLSFLELSEAVRVIPQQQPSPSRTTSMTPPQGPAVVEASSSCEAKEEQLHIIAQSSQTLAGQPQKVFRLGFKIEQRTLLRRHIQQLKQCLDKASAELKACL